jgi:monoamine oxidase
MQWDVIVVGGGVAGLAAANRLVQGDPRVLLLEARPRLGGRVHTVLDPTSGHPIELGAEFIQGNPEELLGIIRGAGLSLYEIPERHGRAGGADRRQLPDAEALLSRLLGTGLDLPDVPVSRLIRERASQFTSGELQAMTAYLEGFHCADLDRFGTAALAENQAAEEEDGGRMFRLAGGYAQLVSQLASLLDTNRAEVRTGTVVTRIRWRPGVVEVETRTGSGDTAHLRGSQVILTLPLGTLKAGGPPEGAVSLDPMPPGWETALWALEMGAAQRIDLRFDTAWWLKRARSGPTFFHGKDEPFPVWWTTSPPDLPFLTGWAGGPRALALAGKSHDELVRLALQSAASVFGLPVESLAGWLQAAYSHDWTSDPFSRGAYSYGGVGASAARQVLARPVDGTLFLAGEAIVSGGRNATVPGALASGFRAAQDLLTEPLAGRQRLPVD